MPGRAASARPIVQAGRPRGWLQLGSAGVLAASVVLGCASDDGPEPEPPSSDGRYHPTPSGVRIPEADACDAVRLAIRERGLALGCSTTLRPCPELLRAQYVTACMQYDEATANGCASYFTEQTACEALDPSRCALVAYAGSEPAGCPP